MAGGSKTSDSKETYRAAALALVLYGLLYLADKLVHFSAIGLSWVMSKDSVLLYWTAIFLLLKRDKTVGFILLGLWLIWNIEMVISWLGSVSGYVLPMALLAGGGILYLVSKR